MYLNTLHVVNSKPLQPKYIKRNISGVLLLDKPCGISSNRALQIVKRIFTASKAGHTGTLDPMATGLLPICFGEATKFSSALLGADKAYEAVLKLGYTSTTGDAEGEISVAGDVKLTLQHVEAVAQSFIGGITQIPPMYSALKHQGKPLYAYARKGVEIERQPRKVTIYGLHVETLAGDEMCITVRCSTGTYVRTLAEDIGRALGCGGAYLTALRRSAVNDFDLSQSYTLDQLEAMPPSQRGTCLHPVDSLLYNFPPVVLGSEVVPFLLQGQVVAGTLSTNDLMDGQKVRLYDQGENFLGLGEITAEGEIAPKRLIAENASTATVSDCNTLTG